MIGWTQMIPDWMLPATPRPANEHPNESHLTLWRDKIMLRDEATCQLCFRHTDQVGHLDVHHMTYENFGAEKTEEGILLCRPCHEEVTREQRLRYDRE